jgi:hypothetical protein
MAPSIPVSSIVKEKPASAISPAIFVRQVTESLQLPETVGVTEGHRQLLI